MIKNLKKIVCGILITSFLALNADELATSKITTLTPTEKKNIDCVCNTPEENSYRVFMSFYLGASFNKTRLKDTSLYHQESIPLPVLSLGFESVFKNGNGFNIQGVLASPSVSLESNYLYESRSRFKWAVLSGLSIGAPILQVTKSFFAMDWTLASRIRIKKHGISLKLKVPLIDNEYLFNDHTLIKFQASLMVGYTYFFTL